jgi:hypothetical protein
MQAPTNSTEHKNSWDADFESMNGDSTPAIDAEIMEEQSAVDADIKRPVHKSPPLKMLVLFLGSAIVVAGVAFAFFGSSFNGGEQQTAKTPKPAATNTLSTSDQERLANAEAANAMGGSNKAFEAHNQDKKEDPAKNAEATKPPVTETPKASPPAVVATKPAVVQPAPKPVTTTPVVYQQPRAIQPAPKAIPVMQPAKIASSDRTVNSNNNQDGRIKSLESKIDKLAAALEKQSAQQNQIKALDKPVIVASAPVKASVPPKETAQTEKPQKETTQQPQMQQVVQTTSPAIDGRATAKLFDPVTVSSSGNNSNSSQSLVRTQLTQPIPTSSGMEIPAGAIVAMNIAVASNGMVTGSSTGVWDVKTQKQLNIPAGALVVEGLKGEPLIARSIKLNDGGTQDADTQSAIWGAVGAGVDGLTRPDTNSSITAGTIVTTATSGGSRDLLVNAAGGFAKSKASSMEKDAAKRRDKLSTQAEMWHLPRNTEVVISARPPMPVADARYSQTSNVVGSQYQTNSYQTEARPPMPVIDSRYSQTSNVMSNQYQEYPPNSYQVEVPPTIPARYAVNPTQR